MKKENSHIAVITGDIVESGRLEPAAREKMPEKLKRIFSSLHRTGENQQEFSIFRGDSFQGIVQDPAQALRTALWIRTTLMKANAEMGSYDCRLAIGVGKVTFMAANALESDGEAFRYSGPALDAMDQDDRLKIVTPWEPVNKEMHVACKLMDIILKRWTPIQAGIIAETLEGKTQNTIAASLDITQPAVSASLKTSGWSAVEELIKRYQTLVKSHVQ
ncbi:SatD family protein [Anseongella ginsenosidimutans]|uniref:SatD family protein n=1 Tax=Anseongella ginsenosidimutans TaxID=496056 RepID=A0A4V2UTR8_9SPHI|nr:SatD family protein [Anseongella ginsenosidimutans]QEC52982.1 hypothetical protein FRZ59_11985 [Anseongella ginsenosidimutans]TCS87386.1 SatD family protein [Anseongella ginsenosidimutans]